MVRTQIESRDIRATKRGGRTKKGPPAARGEICVTAIVCDIIEKTTESNKGEGESKVVWGTTVHAEE